jgi:hypothetical protein
MEAIMQVIIYIIAENNLKEVIGVGNKIIIMDMALSNMVIYHQINIDQQ